MSGDPRQEQQQMPTAFFGHGSPMNALERNRYTESWRAFGRAVPRPRAIVCISAHWFINATAVTAMPQPRTIHDFYGFPRELFAVEYPAPGAPDVAAEIADALRAEPVGLDRDSWGIDHGTWSVLVHAYPQADVPVVQLSINALKPFAYHFELGRRLAPLRERGVLIVASGNVVHNLRLLDREQPDLAFPWARDFDAAARAALTANPADVLRLNDHPAYALAAPTPEHFLPLLYFAGLASAAATPACVLVDGYAFGSLSMAAYTIGAEVKVPDVAEQEAAGVPDIPADETNL
jgi:4,5-DOPA dioxygenase extradiol